MKPQVWIKPHETRRSLIGGSFAGGSCGPLEAETRARALPAKAF